MSDAGIHAYSGEAILQPLCVVVLLQLQSQQVKLAGNCSKCLQKVFLQNLIIAQKSNLILHPASPPPRPDETSRMASKAGAEKDVCSQDSEQDTLRPFDDFAIGHTKGTTRPVMLWCNKD